MMIKIIRSDKCVQAHSNKRFCVILLCALAVKFWTMTVQRQNSASGSEYFAANYLQLLKSSTFFPVMCPQLCQFNALLFVHIHSHFCVVPLGTVPVPLKV